MSKKKDIALALLIVSISAVFVLGMILWPTMPKEDKVLRNLYYITTASVLYMMSWVTLMMSNSLWLKIPSCVGVAVFSVNLYVEVYLDPRHWTVWNWWLILFVSLNMFLAVVILEKLKNKR